MLRRAELDQAYLGFTRGHGSLAGCQASGGDARHRALGGEGGRGVDEGRAVPERRAHEAWLPANQLLVHLQRHWGGWVGEAQRRTGVGDGEGWGGGDGEGWGGRRQIYEY